MPAIVLAVALLLTAAATTAAGLFARGRDRARFEAEARAVTAAISARLDAYFAMLLGTAGLFASSDVVDPDEFRSYVAKLDLARHYPGARGIGMARRLTADSLEVALAESRRLVAPDFAIRPAGDRPEYGPILLLEPLDQVNRRALGYDMFSEPVRREAMMRSRETGDVALSGRVQLVQNEVVGDTLPGFLIYLPLYRNGADVRDAAARRQHHVGWVYAPFRARELLDASLGAPSPGVRFRVYDDVEREESLLYDSGQEEAEPLRVVRRDTLVLGGRRWVVASAPAAGFSSVIPLFVPAIALVGIVLSSTLYLLTLAQVRARRAAEQSEEMRSRFFAAMSHELRTPLNAIIGYNDLLLAEIYGALAASQREGIERSQRAAQHLHELVNDVLDLSKIEAGKIEIEHEEVRLDALVQDLSVTIGPMADRWGCELVLDCTGCRHSVRSDPRRLRQILLNLLSNAVRFGTGHPVHVRCEVDDQRALVTVRDQGPGIPSGEIARIFDEFVQLPGHGKGGTGLGLPISRRLATLLGGRLEAESVVGEGSTFRLILPLRAPHSRSLFH